MVVEEVDADVHIDLGHFIAVGKTTMKCPRSNLLKATERMVHIKGY